MTANRDLLDADSLIRLVFGSSTETGLRPTLAFAPTGTKCLIDFRAQAGYNHNFSKS